VEVNRLRELREEAILTVRELADRSGVSEDTITKLEHGHRNARPSTIRKLAKALDVTPQQLRRAPEPAVPLSKAPREAGPTEDTRIADRRRVTDVVETAHNILRDLGRERRQDRAAAALLSMMTYFGLYDWISTTESLAEAEGESPASRRAKRELETAVEAIGETAAAIMAGTESEKDTTITRLKDYRRAKEAG
jgi:transcriptional regulator with XRE-family HTH domain